MPMWSAYRLERIASGTSAGRVRGNLLQVSDGVEWIVIEVIRVYEPEEQLRHDDGACSCWREDWRRVGELRGLL